jgi:uncharacterized protein YuzE
MNKMKVAFVEQYDTEDDIYYVSFQTGEPSLVQEVDDVVLVEVGMYSKLPTGFRILNFTKSKIKGIHFFIRKIGHAFPSNRQRQIASCMQTRRREIAHSLEKVLA